MLIHDCEYIARFHESTDDPKHAIEICSSNLQIVCSSGLCRSKRQLPPASARLQGLTPMNQGHPKVDKLFPIVPELVRGDTSSHDARPLQVKVRQKLGHKLPWITSYVS